MNCLYTIACRYAAGRRKRLVTALAAVLALLALMAGAAAAEERHTVVFRCGGGGYTGIDAERLIRRTVIEPQGEVSSADGRKWTLEELRGLEGFRLEGAALRFTADAVNGLELRYALQCGKAVSEPQHVRTGRNLWDVTAPLQAWLETPEEPLSFVPVYVQSPWGMQTAEGSASLQVTFYTTEKLADFPQDKVRYDTLYEASLCMLEDGNPFVEYYDETAGSLMTVTLPLGVPYYYAGGSEDKFLRRFFPDTTTAYYKDTHMYLCGLDCVGMTHLIYEKCGLERHPSISDLLNRGVGAGALANDPMKWSTMLQPGELIAVKHGTYHVLMYLGTMRQFGFTEREAGEAADMLDAPLVIHCGGNPFYYDRYGAYIREQGYRNTMPPDGGVTVSVVRQTDKDTPHSRDVSWGKHFGWYELAGGEPLLVFRLEDCTEIAWYGPEETKKAGK